MILQSIRFASGVLTVLLLAPLVQSADPTDNPVATYYSGPEGYPAWTDSLRWSKVINMKTYPRGKTAFEKFENARGDLVETGGVLFYPAGVYDFSTMPAGVGLMLVPGVIIRGEAPAGHPVAADGKLELRTKFIFNFRSRAGGKVPRDWNFIGMRYDDFKNIKSRNDLGIAWVHLDGATIAWGPQVDWGKTWATSNSLLSGHLKKGWSLREPSGTHPIDVLAGGGKIYKGVGRGRLVFGCVFEDAAVLDDYSDPGYGPDGFTASPHCARIVAYGTRVLVANNLLPKSRKSFSYRQQTDKKTAQLMFDYGKTCGIDINKQLFSEASANGTCAGYFEQGIVVRDNFVYNHGHTGYSVAGKWVTITGNTNERAYLRNDISAVLTLDGYTVATPTSDTLSRPFDLAGRNLWVDRNKFNNTGSSPGLGGEGIVGRMPGGTPIFSWAITHNVHTRGVGSAGGIGSAGADCHGLLVAWNRSPGWVGCRPTHKGATLADCTFLANKGERVAPDEKAIAVLGLKAPLTAIRTAPAAPTKVTASIDLGDAVEVTWTSAASSAAGFRVERRIAGGKWQAIAYRPGNRDNDPENPPTWVDFTAPPGKELSFRVIAIDAADSEKSASEPSDPVTLPGK
ncbi:MAG TPA: fibronectin type III domain-containing protein [Urbifossiella sp.]|nr:fibronectin type III domain-containing protein [Urbifossiella sp.]